MAGELDSVVKQVVADLPDPMHVAEEIGYRGIEVDVEREPSESL
jgi:hypothetical protein